MTTKKKHKRIHLTPQQAMQRELNKSEERALKRIFSEDDSDLLVSPPLSACSKPSTFVVSECLPISSSSDGQREVRRASSPASPLAGRSSGVSAGLPAQVEPIGETSFNSSPSLLLTVSDLCLLLKVSKSTLIRMDRKGLLPGRVKIGGIVRYDREKIERWVSSLSS